VDVASLSAGWLTGVDAGQSKGTGAMKTVRAWEPEGREAIAGLIGKLSILKGAVSAQSREKTVAVFGEPLSPQEAVRRIVDDVRRRGDEALFEYERKLAGVELTADTVRVSDSELERAHREASPELMKAVRRARLNIESFQRQTVPRQPEPIERAGVRLELRYAPLRRVGLYVAGGIPLPSAVLMNAVPAQVAGVEQIVVVSPCGRTGQVDDAVLATCAELGIVEIYRIGGAQAVAALAFGTASVARVDKIVGGANIFASLAKKEVFGLVDAGFIAGPSEVLVIADQTADPAFVAADLISQTEHNPGSAVLVTTSEELAGNVAGQVDKQLSSLPRPGDARRCLDEFGLLVLVENLEQAAEVADRVAPEHLQVITSHDRRVLGLIHNAGTILVGPYSPVAASDYLAGPSHVLPTGGGARFASGLTARDFIKSTSIVQLAKDGLERAAPDICTLAETEGLLGHAHSVRVRLEPPTEDDEEARG